MRDPLPASPRQEYQAMRDRDPKIRVVVNTSVEAIDFDAWAARYVQAVLAVDRQQQKQADAA
jgi:hypothetical protein